MIIVLSSLFIACFVSGIEAGADTGNPDTRDWTYTDQGAWKNNYPSCGLNAQSPIDIPDVCFKKDVKVNNALDIELINYDKKFKLKTLTLKNTGATSKMVLEKATEEVLKNAPKITGTALNNNTYQFAELHFHWNQNDARGSEHSFNEAREALEMHLVHWNTKYETMAKAVGHPDGLAVYGILFNVNTEENPALNPIIDYLNDIVETGSGIIVGEKFSLLPILPKTHKVFYRYQGSLTTPPCTEVVTWLVAVQVQKIGYSQLHEFAHLENRETANAKSTKRDIQPLNGRLIEVSSDAHCKRPETHDEHGNKKLNNAHAHQKFSSNPLSKFFRRF